MEKSYLIIYHKEDNDGVFSGAMFYDYLLNNLKIPADNITLMGADYNLLSYFAASHVPEDLKEIYDNIIMTDISFNSDYMKKLYDEFDTKFIWCDHHAPIIKESERLKFSDCSGIRNTNKSAILCVYEYLYDQFNVNYNTVNINEPVPEFDRKFPEFFRILSGWDSWSYEREGYSNDWCRHINKGTTVEFNLDFDKILTVVNYIIGIYQNGLDIRYEHDLISNMYNLGKQLNDYDDSVMENIIKTSGDCSWKVVINDEEIGHYIEHSACAIFHQGATNSLMFKSLKTKGINHGLVFKHQVDGNWVLSMYNVNEYEWLHCGEFLKEKYGGGGHKGAAGCTLTEEQFINILKNKTV